MKVIKRFLGIALAFVLALGLFVPAVAVEAGETNPMAPIITHQPNAGLRIIAARVGSDITLRVRAALPEGVEGELSFAWFQYGYDEPFATGAQATIEFSMELREVHFGLLSFYVVVTNTYLDDEGQEQTVSVTSQTTDVAYFHTIPSYISNQWNVHRLLFGWLFFPLLPLLLANMSLNTLIYTAIIFPTNLFFAHRNARQLANYFN